jgi:hypothetical protein
VTGHVRPAARRTDVPRATLSAVAVGVNTGSTTVLFGALALAQFGWEQA